MSEVCKSCVLQAAPRAVDYSHKSKPLVPSETRFERLWRYSREWQWMVIKVCPWKTPQEGCLSKIFQANLSSKNGYALSVVEVLM